MNGGGTPEKLIAPALTDFLGMVSDYTGMHLNRDNAVANRSLSEDMSFNARTDTAFDSVLQELNLRQSLKISLVARGIGKKAASGCVAAGLDILFDGVMLDNDGNYPALLEHMRRHTASGSFGAAIHPLLRSSISRYFQDDRARSYADPEAVAGILWNRFEHRPRQAFVFSHSDIPKVGEALDESAAELKSLNQEILKRTYEKLRGTQKHVE